MCFGNCRWPNGCPLLISTINNNNAFETIDQIVIETGHNILENKDQNETIIQTTIESYLNTPLQCDRINQFISMNLLVADKSPINEFTF